MDAWDVIADLYDGPGKVAEQQPYSPILEPSSPPSPCEMCNGVGFYVSLPGDVISPCPWCSDDDA